MRPTRRVPAVSDHGEIVFELNRLMGHWVRRGDPYWGTRFRLGAAED